MQKGKPLKNWQSGHSIISQVQQEKLILQQGKTLERGMKGSEVNKTT